MTTTNSSGQTANTMPYRDARTAYAELWTMCGVPAKGADGADQPRLDLLNSSLLAVSIPASVYFGHAPVPGAVAALGSLAGVPAVEIGAGSVTLLYAAPGLPAGAPRHLDLDVSMGDAAACYRSSERGNIALPCLGSKQRWAVLPPTGAPAVPEVLSEVATRLAVDEAATDHMVQQWLRDMFEPSGSTGVGGWVRRAAGDPIIGLTRVEVHDLLCRATGWTVADYSLERLSRVAEGVPVTKHKRKDGYVWLLQRRADVPLRAPNGVPVETIDGTLLELARSLHITREHNPERKRQRAAEQAAAEQRAESARMVRERYGSAEVLEALIRLESGEQIGGENFFQVLERGEYKRQRACDAMAIEYRPLRIQDAKPEWFAATGGPETPHMTRYRALVRLYAAVATEVEVA